VKNITITLDERTAAWTRIQAAKQNMSVSRFVGEVLQKQMTDLKTYNEAMRKFFSVQPTLSAGWVDGNRPTRDEIYDRPRVR